MKVDIVSPMFLQCINEVVPDEFKISGHEVIEGEVKQTGNGAHVLVPRGWLGTDVKIVRVTDPDHDV